MIFGPLGTPERQMRVAAEEHRLADALREEIVFALRDDAYDSSQLLS